MSGPTRYEHCIGPINPHNSTVVDTFCIDGCSHLQGGVEHDEGSDIAGTDDDDSGSSGSDSQGDESEDQSGEEDDDTEQEEASPRAGAKKHVAVKKVRKQQLAAARLCDMATACI